MLAKGMYPFSPHDVSFSIVEFAADCNAAAALAPVPASEHCKMT